MSQLDILKIKKGKVKVSTAKMSQVWQVQRVKLQVELQEVSL